MKSWPMLENLQCFLVQCFLDHDFFFKMKELIYLSLVSKYMNVLHVFSMWFAFHSKEKKITGTIIHWFRTCSYYFALCFCIICLVLAERTLCEKCQGLSINLTRNHGVVRRLTMVLFKHPGAEIDHTSTAWLLAGIKQKQN